MFPIDFLSYLRHDLSQGTGIYFVVKLDSMFHFCWVLIFSEVRSLEGSDFLLQQPAGMDVMIQFNFVKRDGVGGNCRCAKLPAKYNTWLELSNQSTESSHMTLYPPIRV